MMKQLRTFVITSLAAVAGAGLVTMARSQNPSSAAVASFNVDGSLNLPRGYRHWVHIGTRLKPIGINILDGLPTKTPEIFNAYVEPHAFTLFRKTGRWPDGTQIVKEFSTVRVGQGCDAATFLCSSPVGAGIFESEFAGLGMMVKDEKRFSDLLATGDTSVSVTSLRLTILRLPCDQRTPARPVTSLSHPGPTM